MEVMDFFNLYDFFLTSTDYAEYCVSAREDFLLP